MLKDDSSVFVGTVRKSGNSLVVTIPMQIVKGLGLNHNDQVWIKIRKLKLEGD